MKRRNLGWIRYPSRTLLSRASVKRIVISISRLITTYRRESKPCTRELIRSKVSRVFAAEMVSSGRTDTERDGHGFFLSPYDEDLRRGNDVPSWNLRFTTPPRLSFGTRASFYRPRFTACRRTKGKRTTNQEHDRLARRAAETRIFIRDDRTIRAGSHATFLRPIACVAN